MAIAKAYGSITIVDINDLGTLSVYPESNSPTQIVYNPDSNKYNPTWSSGSPLLLTPTINYGGKALEYPGVNNSVKVEWYYKKGMAGSYNQITQTNSSDSSAYIDGAVLKVPSIPFQQADANDTDITYKCKVIYTEPNSKQQLTAEGQISFSLINQPATTKFCTINGESVFKYDSSKTIVGATEIILTARVVGCSITGWQYLKGTTWETISNQTGTTLKISHNDVSYFANDTATFKVVTDQSEVFDTHSITKLYDGAAGGEAFLATLTNEDSYVACDSNGDPTENAFNGIYTGWTVYFGDDDISDESALEIAAIPAGGVLGYWRESNAAFDKNAGTSSRVAVTGDDAGNKVYQITSVTNDSSVVNFEFKYTYPSPVEGEPSKARTSTKTMYLTKLKAGQDGVTPKIYKIHCPTAVKKDKEGNYGELSISADEINGATVSAYKGRYKILNGAIDILNKSEDYDTLNFKPSTGLDATTLVVQLYAQGGFTSLLDTQTITVVSDGVKGDPGATGATGAGGLSFVFPNSSEQIPCTDAGTAIADYVVDLPFSAYQGITQLKCTAQVNNGTIADSITVSGNTSSSLKITFVGGTNLGGNDSGIIKVTLTASDDDGNVKGTASYPFSWSKNKQGKNGTSAVLLRTYSPTGNIINNGENDVTLTCSLLEGATDVTNSSTVKWSVFDNSATEPGYKEITSAETHNGHTINGATLTVPAAAVQSYASYKVDVTYSGKTYTDYIVVLDKTDPLQVEIYSTLGDKITNSVGIGCIYAKVYQNGVELDKGTVVISDMEPSQNSETIWVQLFPQSHELVAKRWNGTMWYVASEPDCNYKWTFADYNGNTIMFNGVYASTNRFLYVDGSLIGTKVQFNLEVTKNNKTS